MVSMEAKETTSLVTTVCSFLFGKNIDLILTYQEQITFILQNTAFLVSIVAGLFTIYFSIRKYRNGKN